jgi:hypothetical protein
MKGLLVVIKELDDDFPSKCLELPDRFMVLAYARTDASDLHARRVIIIEVFAFHDFIFLIA